MKYYMVMDKSGRIIYGVSDKEWLARLFYVQRNEYESDMIILRRKHPYLTKHNDCDYGYKIRYVSGYALLNYEVQYIEHNLLSSGYDYYERKYKRCKRVRKFLKRKKREYLDLLVRDCIEMPKMVFSYLDAITEFEYKMSNE